MQKKSERPRNQLTHLDEAGQARMVDVGHKQATRRTARAEGFLRLAPATVQLIRRQQLPKGNPFEVARVAAIQASKRTFELIPLCHLLPIDQADVEVTLEDEGFHIHSLVACHGPTGVEMEALTAVAVAALTLYDMCKAVDKQMTIERVRLVEKTK